MYESSQKKPAKNNNNLFLITGLFILVVLLVIAVFLITHNRNNNVPKPSNPTTKTTSDNGINLGPPSEAEVKNAESEKVQKIESPKTSTTEADKVIISKLSQDSSSKDLVVITELHGQNWSSCDLRLTSGPNSITKTANVIYQNTYSSCAGYSVPAKDLPGDNLTVRLIGKKSDGNSVASEAKTIQVTR